MLKYRDLKYNLLNLWHKYKNIDKCKNDLFTKYFFEKLNRTIL
jgi:hypothetical protein